MAFGQRILRSRTPTGRQKKTFVVKNGAIGGMVDFTDVGKGGGWKCICCFRWSFLRIGTNHVVHHSSTRECWEHTWPEHWEVGVPRTSATLIVKTLQLLEAQCLSMVWTACRWWSTLLKWRSTAPSRGWFLSRGPTALHRQRTLPQDPATDLVLSSSDVSVKKKRNKRSYLK